MQNGTNPTEHAAARGDEKFFLILILAVPAVAGFGSWFAVVALTAKDNPRGIAPDHARRLENFSFTNLDGNKISRADVDGKIIAVSFLFTSCSLTCPEVTKRMVEIQGLTASSADVRLVSLTVDPRTDTPSVLAKWGIRFNADTNRWHFLTGEKPMLYGLIGTSFLAQDSSDPFNSMPGNFTGTERIAVVDAHGRTRIYFDGLRNDTPAAVVAEIAQLRREP